MRQSYKLNKEKVLLNETEIISEQNTNILRCTGYIIINVSLIMIWKNHNRLQSYNALSHM